MDVPSADNMGTLLGTDVAGPKHTQKNIEMTEPRQQILVLHLESGDLGSSTVAWALYDGTLGPDEVQMQAGSENKPPYLSVLDAMRDGWRVFQASPLPERSTAAGTGQLANEFWLERIEQAGTSG